MRKTIIIICIVVAFISIGLAFSHYIAPGSYAYAETYEMDVEESTLIKAIESFKKNNPEYIVPEQTQLTDGRRGDNDYWHHVYFYYPEENQIVKTWTRPSGKGKTTFALIGVNDGLNLGNWKQINKDYSRKDNKAQKKKFELRILNKIKQELSLPE